MSSLGRFKKCKWCGNIYDNPYTKYCDDCSQKLDESFVTIREYVYDNPDATIVEVCEETGIEEDMVLHFLKEGRLEMKDATGLLHCEKCGRAITSGRMCNECKKSLSQVFEKTVAKGLAERSKIPGRGFKSQPSDDR